MDFNLFKKVENHKVLQLLLPQIFHGEQVILDLLDNAMLRRLEKRIYIPLPGLEGVKKMYEINLKDVNLD